MNQTAWLMVYAVCNACPRDESTAPASLVEARCPGDLRVDDLHIAYDLCSSPGELPADLRHVAGVVAASPAPHCGALHRSPREFLSLVFTTSVPPLGSARTA
jgi:hypothetical protein